MKTIREVEKEINQEFHNLPDIDAKYNYLFEMGENLPKMDPAMKNDQNKVRGCQSELWFHLSSENGKYHLSADSDSMVIKGIAALLVRLVEGRSAEEMKDLDLDFIDALDIWKLPSARNNSLMAMLEHIKSRVRQENNLNLQFMEEES